MSSYNEFKRLLPGKWNNKEFDVTTAASTVTIYLNDSGTDVPATNTYYFGLGNYATHINIRSSGTVLLKKRNGIAPTTPVTVTAAGGYVNSYGEWDSIELETTVDNQNIKIEAMG